MLTFAVPSDIGLAKVPRCSRCGTDESPSPMDDYRGNIGEGLVRQLLKCLYPAARKKVNVSSSNCSAAQKIEVQAACQHWAARPPQDRDVAQYTTSQSWAPRLMAAENDLAVAAEQVAKAKRLGSLGSAASSAAGATLPHSGG